MVVLDEKSAEEAEGEQYRAHSNSVQTLQIYGYHDHHTLAA